MPDELQLPDGRILVLPDNMTLSQRTALQNKLSAQYPDLKTGRGMEQRAQQQAMAAVRRPLDQAQVQPQTQGEFNNRQDAAIQSRYNAERAKGNVPLSDMDVALMGLGGGGAIRTLATKGLKAAAVPIIRGTVGAVGGSAAGRYGGSEIGRMFGGPKGAERGAQVGSTIGGLAGGIYGGISGEAPAVEEAPFSKVSESPGVYRGPSQVALSQRMAAEADTAARKAVPVSESPGVYRGPSSVPPNVGKVSEAPGGYTGPASARAVMTPGTAAKESGYTPPVTRVPIRPTPQSPLTPEQVPGPDTPGRGNLLTPAARRGDPRAAQELMRRGRSIIYTPAEEYPGTRLEGTLSERLAAPPTIPTPEAAPAPTFTQRVAQGVSPTGVERRAQSRVPWIPPEPGQHAVEGPSSRYAAQHSADLADLTQQWSEANTPEEKAAIEATIRQMQQGRSQ